MDDLGSMSSYMALRSGMPVFSSDGKSLGKLERVLGDVGRDIFDGLIVDTSALPGGHRFVDASQVEKVYERGVVLAIDADEAEGLPGPSASQRRR